MLKGECMYLCRLSEKPLAFRVQPKTCHITLNYELTVDRIIAPLAITIKVHFQ